MILMSTLVLSLFCTIILVPIFIGIAGRYRLVDRPGGRKIHNFPIPKTGGISAIIGALIPIMLWIPFNNLSRAIFLGAGIIILFGLLDDFFNLHFSIKFAGQLAAAMIVVYYGDLRTRSLGNIVFWGSENLPEYVSIPLTIIVIVGITNAINLSDGLDGLAGGISLLSLSCIGLLAYISNLYGVAVMAIAMVGALLGFLRFNTFPASVFMGDSGSQLLGFLTITLSLLLTQGVSDLSPTLVFLLIGFPVLDTVLVIIQRISDGQSPFKADNRHFHHRLLKLKLYHTESVLSIYAFHSIYLIGALLLRNSSDWIIISFFFGYSLFIFFVIATLEWKGWQRGTYSFFKKKIKRDLRLFGEKKVLIKIGFKTLQIAAPLLFLLFAFSPSTIPFSLSIMSFVMLVILLSIIIFKKEWLAIVLKLNIYFLIPFVVYTIETEPLNWSKFNLIQLNNILFGIIAIAVIITLKMTSRKNGFKSTPMDFLILFIVLIVPNLLNLKMVHQNLGTIAAKIIVFYFAYEVLIGELRGKLHIICGFTLFTLSMICFRAVI